MEIGVKCWRFITLFLMLNISTDGIGIGGFGVGRSGHSCLAFVFEQQENKI